MHCDFKKNAIQSVKSQNLLSVMIWNWFVKICPFSDPVSISGITERTTRGALGTMSIQSFEPRIIRMHVWSVYNFDIHGSVHRGWFSRNTNKMQLCSRIYCSKIYWRLNMFRAANRSSSGALNCTCSLWFIYPCGDRPLSRLRGKWISHSALATAGHHVGI